MKEFLKGKVALYPGDCREVMAGLAENSVDSCVTDPPYHLLSTVKRFAKSGGSDRIHNGDDQYGRLSRGFMGKSWDGGDVAFKPETWAAVLRVLKPGAYLVAFGAPKNSHRLACAIEDAGFEIRDTLMWLFGSGFPKSHSVSKGIDRTMGAEPRIVGSRVADDIRGGNFVNQESKTHVIDITEPSSDEARLWSGWGTALKPAFEPIIVARKPLARGLTVAENVLAFGTGAINIDGCRVEGAAEPFGDPTAADGYRLHKRSEDWTPNKSGRWPANIVHDGSEEVVGAFPDTAPSKSGEPRTGKNGNGWGLTATGSEYDDNGGSAARFFYSAKADSDDRLGSKHPTVKPLDLMRWLCRLITPPGGLVLDPFAGTGTTGEAAFYEGFRAALIEREADSQVDIGRRMELVMAGPDERLYRVAKFKDQETPVEAGPLFSRVGL